jgi:hypothetical protein
MAGSGAEDLVTGMTLVTTFTGACRVLLTKLHPLAANKKSGGSQAFELHRLRIVVAAIAKARGRVNRLLHGALQLMPLQTSAVSRLPIPLS